MATGSALRCASTMALSPCPRLPALASPTRKKSSKAPRSLRVSATCFGNGEFFETDHRFDTVIGNVQFYDRSEPGPISPEPKRLCAVFHKYNQVCGEGLLAQTRREVLPHGHQRIPFRVP